MPERAKLKEIAEKKLKLLGLNQNGFDGKQTQELIHDLQVYQVELEMQNEELVKGKEENENLFNKYHDLYEFAPVGYVTLDQTAIILETNLTATILLGKKKRFLIKRRFQSFINPLYVDNFYLFMQRAFKEETRQTMEIELIDKNRNSVWTLLEAIVIKKENTKEKECRLAIIDIDEKKKSAIKLNASIAEAEILTVTLATQEEERMRISESLHNGIGQLLYAIKLMFERIDLKDDLEQGRKQLKEIDLLLLEAIDETRRMSFELMPRLLKDYGLKEALEELIRRVSIPKLHFDLDLIGLDKRIGSTIETHVFRIIQELITNVSRHSGADHCKIVIVNNGDALKIEIEDNGIGFLFNETKKGIGIKSIQNRISLLHGNITFISSAVEGVKICITIPL
ncbi:MAG TPA: histidine kinase [Cytophagaceae bacterium]